MFTSISEFKFLKLVERSMHGRSYRIVHVYDCAAKKEFSFNINRFVELPKLKRYEKILIELVLYTRGTSVIPKINSIQRKEAEKECLQTTQN